MSEFDFSKPQRQSKVGLILIFTTAVYHLVRNLWVLVVYFLVRDIDQRTLILISLGLVAVLILTLVYSVIAFMNFKFHLDERNREFILQKGVFSTDVINVPFTKIQQVNFKRTILQRVIGVYSVVIETAGSHEKEVEIKALSQDKANELADQLVSLKRTGEGEELLAEEIPSETFSSTPEWQYKVSFMTLIKLGLTSNYLRGVGLIMAFYFTLREQFMLEETLPGEIPNQNFVGAGSLIFIMGLLVIGMIITVGETVIKYYDLNLKKFSDSLQVEMGLRNNTKVNLKARRIQLMQVVTNPIQQWIGLYKLKISLASSEDDLEKSQINIPGLPEGIIKQVKEYFFNADIFEKHFILPSKLLLLRKISRGMIPVVIGLLGAYFYRDHISLAILGGAISIYLILLTVYNFFYYKSLRLSVSEDFLIKHSGIWNRKQQYIEMYRLQSISVRQPLWYKRRGLVSLIFHSAGGDIDYAVVKQKEVMPLVNYLIYKIEATSRAWM